MEATHPLLPVGAMSASGVQICTSPGLVPYPEAVAAMEARVAAIRAGTAPEALWFVEHPPLYTAGTSAQDTDLLEPQRFPVHRTGRGGQYTYHGPGQRVVYAMLDLQRPRAGGGADIRRYVHNLEDWMIRTLARFGITGERRSGRVGIWVERPGLLGPREDKVGAIGVRVRHWITYHGIALNVAPDLSHFSGIVPCGVAAHGVTSLRDLGVAASMETVDEALRAEFEAVFGQAVGS
jgi:lipoyl(octanoyl) transferase